MKKPSSIVYAEFADKLQNIINETELPAFVMIPVVREVLRQLTVLNQSAYKRDVEAWAKEQEAQRAEVNTDGEQKD